jgi:hypothetical protein
MFRCAFCDQICAFLSHPHTCSHIKAIQDKIRNQKWALCDYAALNLIQGETPGFARVKKTNQTYPYQPTPQKNTKNIKEKCI